MDVKWPGPSKACPLSCGPQEPLYICTLSRAWFTAFASTISSVNPSNKVIPEKLLYRSEKSAIEVFIYLYH